MIKPRPYQERAVNKIVENYQKGINKQVFQLPTGGGKTITASTLIKRFLDAITNKNVVFVVHRSELLIQFRRAMYEQFGIVAEAIVAGIKYRNPNHRVYATMVETAHNRLKKNPMWFGDVGLVIVDECHLGNHSKLYSYFDRDDILIVGLTATPLTASRKRPLKLYYQDIVQVIDIPDLIKSGSLTPNKTYVVKGQVDRKMIKIRNGEFDQKSMFDEYRKGKHIINTVRGYEKHALGKKTLIFNCNIEHSELVNTAFLNAGYNSKHLDGATSEEERRAILHWFSETPDAILQNVGILTAGFDEPSTECIIMNRATLSLPLWLQCAGRGSRIAPGKEFFTIIDMGGNAQEHGDWSTPRDWASLFHNPPKPGAPKETVAPITPCVKCEAIIPAQARTCPFCQAEQPQKETEYDTEEVDFELFTDNISMNEISNHINQIGHNPYASLHKAKEAIVAKAKQQQMGMNDTIAYNLLEIYQEKVREWCKIHNKNYDSWHQNITSKWFFDELKKQMKFELPPLSIKL